MGGVFSKTKYTRSRQLVGNICSFRMDNKVSPLLDLCVSTIANTLYGRNRNRLENLDEAAWRETGTLARSYLKQHLPKWVVNDIIADYFELQEKIAYRTETKLRTPEQRVKLLARLRADLRFVEITNLTPFESDLIESLSQPLLMHERDRALFENFQFDGPLFLGPYPSFVAFYNNYRRPSTVEFGFNPAALQSGLEIKKLLSSTTIRLLYAYIET